MKDRMKEGKNGIAAQVTSKPMQQLISSPKLRGGSINNKGKHLHSMIGSTGAGTGGQAKSAGKFLSPTSKLERFRHHARLYVSTKVRAPGLASLGATSSWLGQRYGKCHRSLIDARAVRAVSIALRERERERESSLPSPTLLPFPHFPPGILCACIESRVAFLFAFLIRSYVCWIYSS
jgi:hypothetical protein